MYGDSYLTHLKAYLKSKGKFTGPCYLDYKVSRRTHFLAVGGSNFENVHRRVTGEDVPATQIWRGNQRQFTIKVKEVAPDFLAINLGANDCDSIDRRLCDAVEDFRFHGHHKTSKDIKEFKQQFVQQEMKNLYKNLDSVVARLKKQYPDARFLYVGIVRRAWWGEHARACAKNIEWWVKRKLNIKVVQNDGFVDTRYHLCNDDVHLNFRGNRMYMDKVFSRIIQIWKDPEMHGEQ